jgi:phosphoribosylformylglycinamidine synthase
MTIANIYVTLKNGILDPQGKTVHHALDNLGIAGVDDVRIGKFVRIRFGDVSEERAAELSREACKKLLANPVIEDFEIEIESGT